MSKAMLVVHHLRRSQSDRIVWLCEELGLPYELKLYDRDPTGAAPPAYKSLHFYGTAPVIQDGDLVMGESGAIVEYLCRKYGGGRLTVEPNAPNFPQYLYWMHFANGTFIPALMMARVPATPAANMTETQGERLRRRRYDRAFDMAEQRLGNAPYFGGSQFTAADIMMMFPLTTARLFLPRDISACPNLLAYLQRIATRPAYRSARDKGDPDLALNLT
jgi:glutathione S-transferase